MIPLRLLHRRRTQGSGAPSSSFVFSPKQQKQQEQETTKQEEIPNRSVIFTLYYESKDLSKGKHRRRDRIPWPFQGRSRAVECLLPSRRAGPKLCNLAPSVVGKQNPKVCWEYWFVFWRRQCGAEECVGWGDGPSRGTP